jgi:hypothetical protein
MIYYYVTSKVYEEKSSSLFRYQKRAKYCLYQIDRVLTTAVVICIYTLLYLSYLYPCDSI